MDVEPKKILVVEDDDFLREIYLDTLKPEGYTVDTAVDGDEAFAKIKQGGYDLVLLDILLPKQDGFAVMKKLKNDPDYMPKNKLLVFLTNLDSKENIKDALAIGNGYLIKSQLTPGDFLKEVKMYLAKTDSTTTPPPTA